MQTTDEYHQPGGSDDSNQQASHSVKQSDNPFQGNRRRKSRSGQEKEENKRSRKS